MKVEELNYNLILKPIFICAFSVTQCVLLLWIPLKVKAHFL